MSKTGRQDVQSQSVYSPMGSWVWFATVLGPLNYSTWLLPSYCCSVHTGSTVFPFILSCFICPSLAPNFCYCSMLNSSSLPLSGGHLALSTYFPHLLHSWLYNFLTIQTLLKLSLPIHTVSTIPAQTSPPQFLSHSLAEPFLSIFVFSRREIVRYPRFIEPSADERKSAATTSSSSSFLEQR